MFRQSVFPIAFKRDSFAAEKFVKLESRPGDLLVASLTWQRYVPTTGLVHEYGCRLASRMNERKRRQGKLGDKDRRVYCGAYELKAGAVRALAAAPGLSEVASSDVVHEVEEGEISHTALRVHLCPGNEQDLEAVKTAIVDRLWNLSAGPLKHVCGCDADLAAHPNSALIVAPRGPYRDGRSRLSRLWQILRFRMLSWLRRALRR